MRRVAAHAGFPHAGVEDVGVRICHRYRTDGTGLELAVGYGRPGESAVSSFEDAAADGAEVVDVRLRSHAGHRDRASATERSDLAEAKLVDEIGLLRDEQQRK